jgi:hypothetical protein
MRVKVESWLEDGTVTTVLAKELSGACVKQLLLVSDVFAGNVFKVTWGSYIDPTANKEEFINLWSARDRFDKL